VDTVPGPVPEPSKAEADHASRFPREKQRGSQSAYQFAKLHQAKNSLGLDTGRQHWIGIIF